MEQESSSPDVRIRSFNPDIDAKPLTKVWVKGLEQTSNAKYWLVRKWWEETFAQYAVKATSPDGDMGPGGSNLERNWCGDEKNRCMLVAVIALDNKSSVLVGCCGIIRGTESSPKEIKTNETNFSIWKMSVDGDFQGKGIGGKLLKAAEDWAKTNGCVNLRMITTNPIASCFYQRHGYGWVEWTWMEWIAFRYLGGYIYMGKWHEKNFD